MHPKSFEKMQLKLSGLFALVLAVLTVSCTRESSNTVQIRDYAEQYAADRLAIDEFLDTHYMVVDPTTYDVDFFKIPDGGTQVSIKDQTEYPLKDTLINEDGITYKVDFIKFREGTQKRPTQVDSVHVAYKGLTLDLSTFDQAESPVWFLLESVISGWSHMLPNFKSGTYTSTPGQPLNFQNYGAGILFLPSGLGYYNGITGTIGSYQPLIFSFKLVEMQYRDHDRDGILSKDERAFPITNWSNNPTDYDTDSDGIPNYRDIDDDNDYYYTKNERLAGTFVSPVSGANVNYYYPLFGASTDDPATPWDESKGIPDCNGDYTTPTRTPRHLNKNCHE